MIREASNDFETDADSVDFKGFGLLEKGVDSSCEDGVSGSNKLQSFLTTLPRSEATRSRFWVFCKACFSSE